MRDARVWGPRQVLVKRALGRLSLKTLETAPDQGGRHRPGLIKGIGRGDVWEEFLRLGLKLSVSGKR